MDSDSTPARPQDADLSLPVDGDMAFAVLEGLADAVYVLTPDFRIVFCNPAFGRHMEMPCADLVGCVLWEVIAQTQKDLLKPVFDRVFATGVAENLIQASVVRLGHTVEVRVFPVLSGIAVVFRDITRRISRERALATSEAHLRLALHSAAMGDWTWDAETDAMSMSEQTLTLYGIGPQDNGMSRADLRRRLLHPDDVPAVREAAERAHANGGQYDVEYRIRRDGDWRWMRVMGGPHTLDGRVIGAHGLVQDIDERKRANARLQAEIEEREKAQQRQQLLIHELNHRVKNILAMVQAIAAQTLSSATDPAAARASLEARLIALAQAHDVLTRESWDGAELLDIVEGAVAPHDSKPTRRFRLGGPRVRLEPKTVVSLAMALHELATNAIKYGALSGGDQGWVDIGWTARPGDQGVELRLSWAELGGPTVTPPQHTGFGTRLIGRSLSAEGGVATVSYPPQGLRCDIVVTLPMHSAESLSI